MQVRQLSSGDVTADRRADYAAMLADGGDAQAAAELMEQALDLTPGWAAGWFKLAGYREKAGDPQGAIQALTRVLDLDPSDIFGAALKRAVLAGGEAPDRPPSGYAERLFDDYAGRFDTALVEKLDYTVPVKLAALVAESVPPDHMFSHAIDLGCGTGLFGAEIRARTLHLDGCDISANMLAKARHKHIYDRLFRADLSQPLADNAGFENARADLVSAADVLMYLGALDGVFSLAGRLLQPGGIFAFSVEDSNERAGFRLGESLRYAHSRPYVEARLSKTGFAVQAGLEAVIRKDGGKPVEGILFLARKHGQTQ